MNKRFPVILTMALLITLSALPQQSYADSDQEVLDAAKALLAACNKRADECFNSGTNPDDCSAEHAACVARVRLPSHPR